MCHMCMCAYTACVTQLSTEVYRPGSPKCNLPLTGLVILWRQIGEGTLDKAPRLLRTGARVRYHFGGFPPHTSSEENTDSPFSKRLIHSISVKWSAERVPCFLSFLPVCARTLQATVARAAIWVRYRK